MEFGAISDVELAGIKFEAPKFKYASNTLLAALPQTIEKVYTGCNMWGHKPWLGILYPPKTKDADMLTLYSQQFNAVELNATHYNFFPEVVFENWAKKVAGNKEFKFCPKVPQVISHATSLLSQLPAMQLFAASIAYLGSTLGACFMQLPESFSNNRWLELKQFLAEATLPANFFVELRNGSWFLEDTMQEVQQFFFEQGIGWVITDAAGKQLAKHGCITVPKLFVRFVGFHNHTSTQVRLQQWAQALANISLQELYFFIHNHNEDFSPSISKQWCQLASATGLPIKVPELYTPPQTSLF